MAEKRILKLPQEKTKKFAAMIHELPDEKTTAVALRNLRDAMNLAGEGYQVPPAIEQIVEHHLRELNRTNPDRPQIHLDCRPDHCFNGDTSPCVLYDVDDDDDQPVDLTYRYGINRDALFKRGIDPESVKECYAAVVGWMNQVNRLLDPNERCSLPYVLQEVLLRYVEGEDVTQSITEAILKEDP